MWIALLQRYYPIMSNSIVHTTWYSIRALPNIIYNIPICLHYVKFLAEEFRNSMHELKLLYGLDLSILWWWWASVSANPRELKALTEAAALLTAAAALSALLFQPREHHVDRRRRFQFTVRTQNKVSKLERERRVYRKLPRKKQDHVFIVGGG